jgi:phage terminase large subunit GpA-like protein
MIYICPHCGNESKPKIDTTGEMPVGMLVMCDCPEARKAWEADHRAKMEARKNATRNASVRSRSIIHAGRTPSPVGKRSKIR